MDVLTALPNPKHYRVGKSTRRIKNQFIVTPNSEDEFRQIGRALALQSVYTTGGTTITDRLGVEWLLLHNMTEVKTIAVCTRNRVMVRREDGKWTAHPISKGLEIVYRGQSSIVTGRTSSYFRQLREAGGKFVYNCGLPYNASPTAQNAAWVFTGEVPADIQEIAGKRFLTKYHFLAARLLGLRIFVQRGEFEQDEAEALILDGYRRELWKVQGGDWKDFPGNATTA